MSTHQSAVSKMRQELLDDLLDGTYSGGSKLPVEDDLAEEHGVSRATVREAVGALVEAGYLKRRQGSGTYVVGHMPRRHALDTSVSYLSMIREAGLQPGLVLLDQREHEATAEEAEALELKVGEPLVTVERIRTADAKPIIYSVDRLPLALLQNNGKKRKFDTSLYGLLADAGHPVHDASARLVPVLAHQRLASYLKVERGTPLLHIEQIDYDEEGRPVMLSSEWHSAEIFKIHVNRKAAP